MLRRVVEGLARKMTFPLGKVFVVIYLNYYLRDTPFCQFAILTVKKSVQT